jgi:NAD(P)-dependent dehydrogenase (short-subunit alcohol dehydrogenase family)
MSRFAGRRAVVTGGAQGIGRAVVEGFVRDGGSAVIADIDGALAERTAREIEEAVRRWGGLDVMISHAGIADVEPFLEQHDASWDRMLAVNLTGAFLCVQEAASHMKESGGGAIVVTGSTNAFWIESNAAAYNASKGGVVALMRSAAIDLAPLGIRVNSVAPGLIRTRLTRYVTDIPENAENYLRNVPLRRFGEPVDVANAILFLASDEASWITGHDLVIDGGQTIGTPLPLPDEPFPGSARDIERRTAART